MDDIRYLLNAKSDVVNIDDYLPFKTVEEINAFCSNSDNMLQYRRAALQKRIFAAGNTKDMKTFLSSICEVIFSTDILGVYKWPLKK